jgi:hypothetical protein
MVSSLLLPGPHAISPCSAISRAYSWAKVLFDPIPPSIQPIFTSNTIALAWGSDVGRVHMVQTETNIASANWQSVTGELRATKTNTAFVLTNSSANNVFYRIVQIR